MFEALLSRNIVVKMFDTALCQVIMGVQIETEVTWFSMREGNL